MWSMCELFKMCLWSHEKCCSLLKRLLKHQLMTSSLHHFFQFFQSETKSSMCWKGATDHSLPAHPVRTVRRAPPCGWCQPFVWYPSNYKSQLTLYEFLFKKKNKKKKNNQQSSVTGQHNTTQWCPNNNIGFFRNHESRLRCQLKRPWPPAAVGCDISPSNLSRRPLTLRNGSYEPPEVHRVVVAPAPHFLCLKVSHSCCHCCFLFFPPPLQYLPSCPQQESHHLSWLGRRYLFSCSLVHNEVKVHKRGNMSAGHFLAFSSSKMALNVARFNSWCCNSGNIMIESETEVSCIHFQICNFNQLCERKSHLKLQHSSGYLLSRYIDCKSKYCWIIFRWNQLESEKSNVCPSPDGSVERTCCYVESCYIIYMSKLRKWPTMQLAFQT